MIRAPNLNDLGVGRVWLSSQHRSDRGPGPNGKPLAARASLVWIKENRSWPTPTLVLRIHQQDSATPSLATALHFNFTSVTADPRHRSGWRRAWTCEPSSALACEASRRSAR